MITTSYFAQLRNIKNPVAICGKSPNWYHGPEFKILAPKYDFFSDYKSGKIDEAGYVDQYLEKVLKPLDPRKIYDTIRERYGDDATLLCYEKPWDFCHRHIVSLWFERNLKIEVPELKFENPKESIIEFP